MTASDDQTVKLWEASQGDLVASLSHSRAVTACAISGNGRRLVSWSSKVGSRDDEGEVMAVELKEWDEDTKTERDRSNEAMWAHEEEVSWCAFLPDGLGHLSKSHDQTALWDAEGVRLLSLSEVERLNLNDRHEDCHQRHSAEAGFQQTASACSPDGRSSVRGAADGRLGICDHETGTFSGFLVGHTGSVLWCAYSADGRYVLSSSADRTFRVWDVERRQEVARLATTGIGSATVSTEPESFAVGERGGRLFLLKLVTP